MQEAALDGVEVAQGLGPVRLTEVDRVRPQKGQLLLEAQHNTAKRVEEEAGILHRLAATLMLGHVQQHAEHLAQVDPPGVKRLSVGQGAEAGRAATSQSRAGVVSRRE